MFGLKKSGSKKILVQQKNFGLDKKVGSKKFDPKKIYSKKNFGPKKKFWSGKKSGSKKRYWSKKINLLKKIILVQKR